MYHKLESRLMFADVHTDLRDGILYITGTNSDDHIALIGGADFDASIVGIGDTTVNGQHEDFSQLSSKAPVLIDFGDGDDILEIADGSFWSGRVSVLGGNGNDRVTTTNAIYNYFTTLFFAGGDGNDSLSIKDRTIYGRIDFEGGAGRDRSYIESSRISSRLNIYDLSGASSINLVNIKVKQQITIVTGNSIDHVNLTNVSMKSDLLIRTRRGNDQVALSRSPFSSSSIIKLGGDDDLLTVI